MFQLVLRILRTLLQTAAITTVLAGAVAAQSISPFQAAPKRQLTEEEIQKQKKLESDYKAAVGKLPEQKAADPWGDVRPGPPKKVQKKQQ